MAYPNVGMEGWNQGGTRELLLEDRDVADTVPAESHD